MEIQSLIMMFSDIFNLFFLRESEVIKMSKIEEIALEEFQINPLYSLVSRGLIAKELKKLNNYDLSILLEMIEWELEDRKFYESLNTEE